LECGGKSDATPLWEGWKRRGKAAVPKAPSPLRFAGALHDAPVFFAFSRGKNSHHHRLASSRSRRRQSAQTLFQMARTDVHGYTATVSTVS